MDGRNRSFKELIEEDGQGKRNFCYTMADNGHIVVAPILNPRMTKKNAQVIKIILDNDEELICTPDHLFRLSDGAYLPAAQLTPQHSLASLIRKAFEILDRHETAVEAVQANSGLYSNNSGVALMEMEEDDNHKIVRIEKLSSRIPVYDLEVPNTHNFALASGVLSKAQNKAAIAGSRPFCRSRARS